MKNREPERVLEIDAPSVSCGVCHFTSALEGRFSVEEGILTWRAFPDPQPRRGPDFLHCGEGGNCGDFTRVTSDWGRDELTGEDLDRLRKTMTRTREAEWKRWEESDER